jgi:hypothetical protein
MRVISIIQWIHWKTSPGTLKKKYSFHSLGGVMEECKSKIQRCSVYDPAKIFFTSKFSHVLFCNPTHKTEAGAANRWGGRLIVNHMDESLWWANQKHWAAVRSYLLHSFVQVHTVLLSLLLSHEERYTQMCGPETIFLSQTGICWISSSNFTMQDHILSTAGDTLRPALD